MLELLIAWTLLVSLIFYALLAGADFGGGFWDLLARGPRAERQRAVIADSIAPVWEANHVWLILVVVLLFTAFPPAFAAIMTALHIPVVAMLIGIVLRGSAFVFRKYDLQDDAVQRRWSRLFGISSLFTPFCQGLIVGGLASGDIRWEEGIPVTGFLAGWTSPFAIACGLFAQGLFAFIAAVYLTVDTAGERALQEDFRRRALLAELALAPIAAAVFFTAREGAPIMFEQLTDWWAPILLVWTSLFAVGALLALWRRRFRWARIAAIGQVSLILLGWCLSQFPYLVVPDLTVMNSAAPEITLRLLVIALALGALVLFPSLYYLFRVFKPAAAGRPD